MDAPAPSRTMNLATLATTAKARESNNLTQEGARHTPPRQWVVLAAGMRSMSRFLSWHDQPLMFTMSALWMKRLIMVLAMESYPKTSPQLPGVPPKLGDCGSEE